MYKQVGESWVLDKELLENQLSDFVNYAKNEHELSEEDLLNLHNQFNKIKDMQTWVNYNYLISALKEKIITKKAE